MAKLNDAFEESLRELVGNITLSKAGLAIGTVKSGFNTANVITYLNGGVFPATKAAMTSQALAAAPGTLAFQPIPTAKTCYIVLALDSAGTPYAVQGEYDGQVFNSPTITSAPTTNTNAARVGKSFLPDVPNGLTPFGYIKVVNASGANFVIGTTLFDAAGVTSTFVDVAMLPAASQP
jgi:hypothetical protein